MATPKNEVACRRKVFAFFIATLVVLGAIWAIGLHAHSVALINEDAQNYLTRVPRVIDQKLADAIHWLQLTAVYLQADVPLTNAVRTGDENCVRDRLVATLQQLPETIHSMNVTVYDAAGVPLFQAENGPNWHATGNLASCAAVDLLHLPPDGLASGPHGQITVRVARVWKSHDVCGGCYIVQADIRTALQQIKDDAGVDVAIVNRSAGMQTRDEQAAKHHITNAIPPAGQLLVQGSTANVPPELVSQLEGAEVNQAPADSAGAESGKIRYRVISIRDPAGALLGKLLCWRDYANHGGAAQQVALLCVGITAAVMLLFAGGFWKLISMLQDRFVASMNAQETEIEKRHAVEETLQLHLQQEENTSRRYAEMVTLLEKVARKRKGAEKHLRQQRNRLQRHADQMECLHTIGQITDRESEDIESMLDDVLKHIRAYYREVDRVFLQVTIDECTVHTGEAPDASCQCRMEVPMRANQTDFGTLLSSICAGEDATDVARLRARDLNFLKIIGDKIGKAIDRRRTLQSLKSSEEQRTKMADAAHDAIIMIDNRSGISQPRRPLGLVAKRFSARTCMTSLPRNRCSGNIGNSLPSIAVPAEARRSEKPWNLKRAAPTVSAFRSSCHSRRFVSRTNGMQLGSFATFRRGKRRSNS